MAHSMNVSTAVSIGGAVTSGSVSDTGDFRVSGDFDGTGDDPITAALSWTLTTRTDNDTGVFTYTGTNPYSGSEIVDVYWTNTDGSAGCRYGMVVSSVVGGAGGTITLGTSSPSEVGAGDNLPAQDTVCTIAEQVSQACVVTGNNVKALNVWSSGKASVTFWEAEAVAAHFDFPAGGGQTPWVAEMGTTGPLATKSVTTVRVSCGDTSVNHITYDMLVDAVS